MKNSISRKKNTKRKTKSITNTLSGNYTLKISMYYIPEGTLDKQYNDKNINILLKINKLKLNTIFDKLLGKHNKVENIKGVLGLDEKGERVLNIIYKFHFNKKQLDNMGLKYNKEFEKLYFKTLDLKKIILSKIKKHKLELILTDKNGEFVLKQNSINIY